MLSNPWLESSLGSSVVDVDCRRRADRGSRSGIQCDSDGGMCRCGPDRDWPRPRGRARSRDAPSARRMPLRPAAAVRAAASTRARSLRTTSSHRSASGATPLATSSVVRTRLPCLVFSLWQPAQYLSRRARSAGAEACCAAAGPADRRPPQRQQNRDARQRELADTDSSNLRSNKWSQNGSFTVYTGATARGVVICRRCLILLGFRAENGGRTARTGSPARRRATRLRRPPRR